MKVKNSGFFSLCVIFVVLLVSCGGEAKKTATKERDTVVIGVSQDPASLDARILGLMLEMRVCENIYDKFAVYNNKGDLEYRLAESIVVSPDGKVYTFNLRKGVKFHNGVEFTADDCMYSFDQWKHSPAFYDIVALVQSYRAVDTHTFEVTLKSPTSVFLYRLTDLGFLLNRKATEEAGKDFGAKPVGTGPYKFLSREQGTKVTLERFDDYYRAPAPIKFIEYKIILDMNTLVVALESGDIDFMYAIPVSSYNVLTSNKEITLQKLNGILVHWLLMNTTVEPFNNVKVRQAVNYAMNRDFMNEVYYEGLATPTDVLGYSSMIGYPTDVPHYTYDTAKAKALLAEAGYPDGIKLKSKITTIANYAKLAEVAQQNLADIGIIAEIEQVENGTFYANLATGNFLCAMSGYNLAGDVDMALNMYRTKLIGSSMNAARYSNPTVDALVEQAVAASTIEQRIAINNQIYDIVQKDSVYAVVLNSVDIMAYNADLVVENAAARRTFVYDMHWKQ